MVDSRHAWPIHSHSAKGDTALAGVVPPTFRGRLQIRLVIFVAVLVLAVALFRTIQQPVTKSFSYDAGIRKQRHL